MASSANVPDFLRHRFGADYPLKLQSKLTLRRDCTIIVGEKQECVPASMRILLDSQQPCLDIQFDEAHVVFPATWTNMKLVLKGTSPEYDAFIETHQPFAIPELNENHQACFFELCPSASPVFAGPFWTLDEAQLTRWNKLKENQWIDKRVYIWFHFQNDSLGDFKKIQGHMSKVVELVRANVHRGKGNLRSFWFAEQNPLSEGEEAPRRPKMPWLLDKTGKCHPWEPYFDFFLDEDDHRCRLVEAAIVEQHVQWVTYKKVFSQDNTHDVMFERAEPNGSYWKLHVWVNGNLLLGPPETAQAKFNINIASSTLQRDRILVSGAGICMRSNRADFAILTRAEFNPALDGERKKIKVTLTIDLKSTGLQINALEAAGQAVNLGDNADDKNRGYSLKSTILAQGTEINPEGSAYFTLNVQDVSTLLPHLQKKRVNYILKKYALDRYQLEAVRNSLFRVVAGIHIVQGPPGNRKTRTALVILLILASLEIKVLIATGSDQAVDTLLLSFHRALDGDPKLRDWCGSYCRFRPHNYQMAALYRARRISEKSLAEDALADCQVEALVVQKATDLYDDESEAKLLIDLLDKDRQSVLKKNELDELKDSYEKALRKSISQCRVVAATLNASGDKNLKASFTPYALLCDEAEHCLEGDTMIPMKGYLTLRAITLIGDPHGLPPTVVSSAENEGANFHRRSLMSRLSRYYPRTLLETNHRCHPEIIDWPASFIHRSEITTSMGNSKASRVGNAWQGFTASLHHFKANDPIGKRRLLIDAEGIASHPARSTSWQNSDHINVVKTLLRAIYADKSSKDRIVPQDVTLICPYRGQAKRVIESFAADGIKYNRCLTIQESRGQESNVVIFMFTKPRSSSLTEAYFVSNRQRLNVALTRAKQLLIVVANLRLWDSKFVSAAEKSPCRFLARFIQDVIDKGHKLRWAGPETVTRRLDGSFVLRDREIEIDKQLRNVEVLESRLSESQSTLDKKRAEFEADRKAMEDRERALDAEDSAVKSYGARLSKRKADLQLEKDATSKKARSAA